MSRLVEKIEQAPIPILVGKETKYLCRCGLSANDPYCDGSHERTQDEKPGVVYHYHKDGTRTEYAPNPSKDDVDVGGEG